MKVPSEQNPSPPLLPDRERPDPPPLLSEQQIRPGIGLSVFVTLFAIVCFAGITWFSINQNNIISSENDLPIVKADNTPIRIRPVKPGGMKIPHQDKLILETLTNDKKVASSSNERLLPRPEVPISKEKLKQPKIKVAELPKKKKIISEAPIIKRVMPIAKIKKIRKKSPIKTLGTKKSLTEKENAVPSPVKEFKIQLASFKSENLARSAWKKYKAKYKSIIGNLELKIEKVEIKTKGTFFRVQGGMLSKNEAEKACLALSRLKQACLIISN